MAVQYILSDYLGQAMAEAIYDKLEDQTFVGKITICQGVIAFGSTLKQCEQELRSTLEDWILLGIKLGHPLPIINNIDLNKEPQLEPMVLAQKPKEGTFVDNWMKYEVGLIDTSQSLDGTFPGNLMAVAKPGKAEKGSDNIHLTVKPTALLSHLIKIFTVENAVVLDPFLGSGSTAVAAVASSRKFIGIERDEGYFEISTKRIEESMKKS